MGRLSVWQFFRDGSAECVRDRLGCSEALEVADRYANSLPARVGAVTIVKIVDHENYTNFEWRFGQGVIFPPRSSASKLPAAWP